MELSDAAILVIGLVISVVLAVVAQVIITSNKTKAVDEHLGCFKDFSATQKVMGSDGNTGLAIDEQRKKICLIDHRQQEVTSRFFAYKDLLSSEISEDGATVTRTVRSSQIGGALIGGLALGGLGAVIGGLSGETQTSGTVKRIDLRITVDDTKNPLHDINFLYLETKKGDFFYRKAIQEARHWHGLIEVLIRRADLEDKATNTNDAPRLPSGSVADELKKLAELRDAGVLSIEEFQQQKARLLGA